MTSESLSFKFEGTKDVVKLAKDGTFINDVLVSGNSPEATPLQKAVSFIEEKNQSVEKTIYLPKTGVSQVGVLVL